MTTAQTSYTMVQGMLEQARASWTIWLKIHAHKTGGGPYAIILQIHDSLFTAIYHAQLHLTILLLSDLYAKPAGNAKYNKAVYSLPFLIEICEKEKRIAKERADECRSRVKQLSRIAKGIRLLRGKYIGHKLRNAPLKDIFAEAGLKNKDLDQLLKTSFWILGQLAFGCGMEPSSDTDIEREADGSLETVLKCLNDKFEAFGISNDSAQQQSLHKTPPK